MRVSYFFFFQAEDGIRDVAVTGVQTCALPIFATVLRKRRTLASFPCRKSPESQRIAFSPSLRTAVTITTASIPVATANSALRSNVRVDGRRIGLLARQR